MSKGIRITCSPSIPRVPPSALRPHPENDNRQTKFMFGKLCASIVDDGFAEPITVRSGNDGGKFPDGGYEIIGGEHRWKAAKKLKMPEVPINDLGCVSDVTARKLIISFNKVRGESDQDILASLVKKIAAEGGEDALASVPIDEDALAGLLDGDMPEIGDREDDGLDHADQTLEAPRATVRDLTTILGMSGMERGDLEEFLNDVRQWSAGVAAAEVPPWRSLQLLLRKNTRRVEEPRRRRGD